MNELRCDLNDILNRKTEFALFCARLKGPIDENKLKQPPPATTHNGVDKKFQRTNGCLLLRFREGV